jgi:hypothetical protein
MTQQVVHAKLLLPDGTTFEDQASFGLTIEATGANTSITPADVQTRFTNFLNVTAPGASNPIGGYLASKITRAASGCTLTLTDVTNHLDGSPAGTPFQTFGVTLTAALSSTDFPPQIAAAVGYMAAYGSDLEHGPTIALPSTDSAIDQGAPATHQGVSRPRARDRGRFYLGPLNQTAFDVFGKLGATFLTDMAAALPLFLGVNAGGAADQTNGVVWSRRAAGVKQTAFFYVDEWPASQRRRADTTANRVHTWVSL